MLSLIYRYHCRNEFSASCLKKQRSGDWYRGWINATRIDLTAEIIVTIDGESAKDLDDAVCVKRTPQGYRLWFPLRMWATTWKCTRDRHGCLRTGNQRLFPRPCGSMLPKKLSENLCSLNPKEKKFAFTADLLIDEDGKIIGSEFYKSIICSKARLTYSEVNRLLDGDTENLGYEYIGYRNELFLMKELADKLYKRRMQQGAIDLDIAEPYLQLNKEGNVIGLAAGIRGNDERIIEDFMLAANRSWQSLSIIHRFHPYIAFTKSRFGKQRDLFGLFHLLGTGLNWAKHIILRAWTICGRNKRYRSRVSVEKNIIALYEKSEYRLTAHRILLWHSCIIHILLRRSEISWFDGSSYFDEDYRWDSYGRIYLIFECETIRYRIWLFAKRKRAEEAEREAEKKKLRSICKNTEGYIWRVISSVLNFGMFVQLSNMAEVGAFSDLAEIIMK